MKCIGYYIVKPLLCPEWCTLQTSHILSVSENSLSEKFPDLKKCLWINYPESNKKQYQKYLMLSDEEFSDFSLLVADLFNNKLLSADVRFSTLEDTMRIYNFLKNVDGYRILGVYTDEDSFKEYENEGLFKIVMSGKENPVPGQKIGYEILGCENCGNGSFSFDSYIINSLYEVIEAQPNTKILIDNQTGLIQNTFEEVKAFCDMIQGQGEYVVWTPCQVREFYY